MFSFSHFVCVMIGGIVGMLAMCLLGGNFRFRRGDEIVRCRDCRFRCLDECTRIDEGFKDYWFAIEPDGFCKWGERE